MSERHTILVVDDEPDVVKSVQDLLRLEYRVLGTTKPQEAMRMMEQEVVHVVMTDQRMPEMTGVQFLARCRNEFPDAIRLLFTGYADIRAVIDAINQGNVYRYITKPWDPDELQVTIRQAVDRYELIVERNRLLAELQEKNAELEAAVIRLQQADQLKSDFIQVASHELRTPLAILLGVTALTMRQPEVSDSMRNWLDRIQQSGDRLHRLVDQLVTMLTAGRFDAPLAIQTTDLGALLTQSADDLRPFIELRHQHMTLDWPKDLGPINIEVAKIRDSLNHLLMNAIKFTPDGGTITMSARRTPDGGAQISISDTGNGIAPVHLSRLFEPFFTGSDVSHHSSGLFEYGRRGLGLGLSVVKAFVEMHHGTVVATSEPGRGTCFTITLPPGEAPATSPS